MQIERIYGPLSTTGTAQAGKTVTRAASNVTEPDFHDSDDLKAAMNNTSDVRPEQVAKAKELAADSNYPSDAQLNQLANFLARNLKAD